MSIQQQTEQRVLRSLRDAHADTIRRLELTHDQYDFAVVAYESAERCVAAATRTLLVADAVTQDENHPMVRCALRTRQNALETMHLALSAYEHAAARLVEMEEHEAAARALMGADAAPLVGM